MVNYCDLTVPYTRVTEHKFFAPYEANEETVISYEYSLDCGPRETPHYPLQVEGSRDMFDAYAQVARATPGV